MPDIDTLMQEWPGEVEELLKELDLPTANIEGEIAQYVDLVCGKKIDPYFFYKRPDSWYFDIC